MNPAELLAEIALALDGPVTWKRDETSLKRYGSVAYDGRQEQNDGGGWRFLIVEYPSLVSTMLGLSAMAASGVATRLGSVVRLPAELADKALRKAKQ